MHHDCLFYGKTKLVVALHGLLDALVELFERIAAVKQYAGLEMLANNDAAVGAAEDSVAHLDHRTEAWQIAVDGTNLLVQTLAAAVWPGGHDKRHLHAILPADDELNGIGACRNAVLGVFGCLADSPTTNGEVAVGGEATHSGAKNVYFEHCF